MSDAINSPGHYTSNPSGIEVIEIIRHMGFNLGNVIKYTMRADLKGGDEDLKKAMFYLQDELRKRAGILGKPARLRVVGIDDPADA